MTMRYSVPIQKATRTTWRVSVTEIAQALGIPNNEAGWFTIESADDDGDSAPLGGEVDVVRWVPHPARTYQHELAKPPAGEGSV